MLIVFILLKIFMKYIINVFINRSECINALRYSYDMAGAKEL